MVTVRDVGWSSFGGYEGGRYVGSKQYKLPQNPSFDEKLLYVTSASEGNLGSCQSYDRAILSCGAIQWIELSQFNVSNMLGYIAENVGMEIVESHLKPAFALSKATFKKTAQGLWRFHFIDGSGKEVIANTEATSRWLFAKGSGKVGTWTDESKLWNKVWISCIANLLEDERTIPHQVGFTAPKLRSFVLSQGRAIVFADGSPNESYAGALKCLLNAYAVNLPAVAEKTIAAAAAKSKFPKWSKQWCLDLMHDLALNSGVSIWPGRYNYKRPALEIAFDVQLPKTTIELSQRAWATQPIEMISAPAPVSIPEPVVVPPVAEVVQPPIVVEAHAAETVVERPAPPPTPPARDIWGTILDFSSGLLDRFKRK